jgi:uncharacterized protein YbbC (DUF1343 family)
MLKDVDTVVIDLQITGCRVYTFKYTIAACLRAAKKYSKKVVLLDRPNPLGGVWVEGNALELSASSFVGEFEIPMRHALSAAETALLFNQKIGAELEIVQLTDWNPTHTWDKLERQWTLTSPNLPTVDSVLVYCGTVLFEGTNISEGRGTTLPFQFIGAPFVTNPKELIARVKSLVNTEGLFLREASFQPSFQKWSGETCNGFHMYITDSAKIRSYYAGLAILRSCIELYKDAFKWKEPPYEYNYTTTPIKLIMGSNNVVEHLTADKFSLQDEVWHKGVNGYIEQASSVLLYKRELKHNL